MFPSDPDPTRVGVSLREIAMEVGVSVSTVSRSLRDAPGVDAETRTRVLKAAERRGYRPPLRSRHSRPCPTLTFLVLSRSHSPGMISDLMTGISRAAVEAETTVLSHQPPAANPFLVLQPPHQPPALRTGSVDGILLLQKWPAEIVIGLSRISPVVSVLASHSGTDAIEIDLAGGVEREIDRLPASEPGRVGFFHDKPTDSSNGLCETCREAAESRPNMRDAVVGSSESIDDRESAMNSAVRGGILTWICADEAAARRFRTGPARSLEDRVRLLVPVGGRGGGSCIREALESAGLAAVRRMLHRLAQPAEPSRTILMDTSFSVSLFSPSPTL